MGASVDVAIVGGGAAGISAARRLHDQGRSVLIIEALDRLGGRAHTVEMGGLAFDLGCAWLHSAHRNPLVKLAQAQGQTLVQGQGAWRHRLPPSLANLQDQHSGWAAYGRLADQLRLSPPASDRAGDAIAKTDPWRGFADAVSSFVNGVELDQLSVSDFLAYEDAAGTSNWRLPSGYGAFISAQGADLPQALATRVRAIRQDRDLVLDTDRGAVSATCAIVTVSSAMLAAGAILFSPGVDEHLHAAAQLPLGLADKVLFGLADHHHVPTEAHLVGHLDRAATGSYYLRPLGRPVIECFLGGEQARALEAAGDDAAIAFATEELAGLFGTDFIKGLSPMAVTRWGREPTIGGSYSHALPGQASCRGVLARPVSQRLCLAGEACSAQDFSTAHGAWESGVIAADWVERHLAGLQQDWTPASEGAEP